MIRRRLKALERADGCLKAARVFWEAWLDEGSNQDWLLIVRQFNQAIYDFSHSDLSVLAGRVANLKIKCQKSRFLAGQDARRMEFERAWARFENLNAKDPFQYLATVAGHRAGRRHGKK
jgi:hypothetical protein